jgi:hypothetical protein
VSTSTGPDASALKNGAAQTESTKIESSTTIPSSQRRQLATSRSIGGPSLEPVLATTTSIAETTMIAG